MGLKNFQYNKILRAYDERQIANRHALEKKQELAYKTIPQLHEFDAEIAEQSVASAKLALSGDPDALKKLKLKIQELSSEKEALLAAHGFPKDYLTPDYTCPMCKDTGYVGKEKCQCFKQAIVDLLYSQSNIRRAIEAENFDTFTFDYYDKNYIEKTTKLSPYDNMKRVVSKCISFIKNFNDSYENLLIYGNPGVGKTFLTNCIARELLNTAHTVIYLTAFQLFSILEKNTFDKSKENFETEEQFQGIMNCDLLIIDDLGTELNSGFISSQLYLIINERYLSRKSTIISTNLSIDDMKRLYNERVFSRITSNYKLLKIVGDDIRLKK
ncbi:ATP-binding protein [[Clostridium] polysaccharolyticum]|uniref:DNA replication protein DnaC n=1 Tax=[Clostridium] polysaccharolyticum TaxID=29364 RepID=A0A1I0FPE5_9FIRM|nr:ATP-binding protein [[Clostridium] polysaccharolyticum]SET60308.1 DNA replication protein DnaC [[Clostridium] polysaccharolyticum]